MHAPHPPTPALTPLQRRSARIRLSPGRPPPHPHSSARTAFGRRLSTSYLDPLNTNTKLEEDAKPQALPGVPPQPPALDLAEHPKAMSHSLVAMKFDALVGGIAAIIRRGSIEKDPRAASGYQKMRQRMKSCGWSPKNNLKLLVKSFSLFGVPVST